MMLSMSQTETAILGALTVQPMTGYQVRTSITEVLGHFWQESFGQIYPALNRLVEQGLISAEPGARASSRVFRITGAGRVELRSRLSEPPSFPPPRNGLLLRVFFGAQLEPEVLRGMLRDYAAEVAARLAEFDAIEAGIEAEDANNPNQVFWLATVRNGRLSAQAQVRWVEQTLASLPR